MEILFAEKAAANLNTVQLLLENEMFNAKSQRNPQRTLETTA